MTKVRLTTNQRDRLLRLGRAAGSAASPVWVRGKDCGGEAALDHLYRKGYVDRWIELGPRGGEHAYYRPTELGWETIARVKARQAAKGELTGVERVAAGYQELHAIDSALIQARDRGEVVRVFTFSGEYRGVPGQVFRRDGWEAPLLLPLGKRVIPLRAITKVLPG